MRQRNISGYPLSIPALGKVVGVGEDIDHDEQLAGFTSVEHIDIGRDQYNESGDEFGEPGKSADGDEEVTS